MNLFNSMRKNYNVVKTRFNEKERELEQFKKWK